MAEIQKDADDFVFISLWQYLHLQSLKMELEITVTSHTVPEDIVLKEG